MGKWPSPSHSLLSLGASRALPPAFAQVGHSPSPLPEAPQALLDPLLWLPADHMSEATGHILAVQGLDLDVRLIYCIGFIVSVFVFF